MGDSILSLGLEILEETENSIREIVAGIANQRSAPAPAPTPEPDQAAIDRALRLAEQARASEEARQLERSRELQREH